MGGINVKNTMVEVLMQTIAPHPCCGCGKIGSVLCAYCKYDIISEPFVGCFLCGTANLDGICANHEIPISKAFIVSLRTGVIKRLIDDLKFQRVKAGALQAAILLNEAMPLLPENTIVVPVPTVSSHVRQRGYDQVALIAAQFSKLRAYTVINALKRAGSATQHVLNKADRAVCAKNAFTLSDAFAQNPHGPFLLLDDIITTGSTVSEAAKLLASQGAIVWVGALAYQPLD